MIDNPIFSKNVFSLIVKEQKPHPKVERLLRYLFLGEGVRELRELFDDDVHYLVFRNTIDKKLVRCLVVSEHYVLFEQMFSEYSGVAIGVNSETDKLFVRAVSPLDISRVVSWSKVIFRDSDSDVIVAVADDRTVRVWAFDYQCDIDYDPLISKLDDRITIRVQGDLLLTVEPMGEEMWENTLLESIDRQLKTILLDEVTRRVREVAEIFGFVVTGISDYGDRRYIEFDGVVSDKVLGQLLEFVDISDIVKEFGNSPDDNIIKIIEVSKKYVYMWLSSNVLPLSRRLAEEIRTYYKKYGETTVRIGRHRVTFECLPTRVTVIRKILGRERIISAELPTVAKGKITFLHPEHKKKEVYLPEPHVISFNTLPTPQWFIRTTNFFRSLVALKHIDPKAFKKIVEKHMIET